MPVITITLAQGQTSAKQKADLIREFTATSTAITGINAQSFTILFHELPEENIGCAGKTLPVLKAERG